MKNFPWPFLALAGGIALVIYLGNKAWSNAPGADPYKNLPAASAAEREIEEYKRKAAAELAETERKLREAQAAAAARPGFR